MLRITEGLWRWTTLYGEWGEEVGCVYYESGDAVVLIDPLVPEDAASATRFWTALDGDVERAGVPVQVLITVFWHTRSTTEVAKRYRARVYAATRARQAIGRRTDTITDLFKPGDTLPGGVVAFPSGRATEIVFWIPEHAAVVPGDVILGADGGGIRLCPESWLPASVDHQRLRAALRPLLDLPVERVLVSHGEPVLRNGHAALERLLAA